MAELVVGTRFRERPWKKKKISETLASTCTHVTRDMCTHIQIHEHIHTNNTNITSSMCTHPYKYMNTNTYIQIIPIQ